LCSAQLTPTQGNPRTTALLAVAKANSLNLDIVHTEPAKGVETEYLKLNKLGKVPTFEGADGYVLTECIAIAIYRTLPNRPDEKHSSPAMMRRIIKQLSLSEDYC
jgi:hypothetical protein